MLPLFWDSAVPTLEHYQAEDETVNSECCRDPLTEELKPATGTKRTGTTVANSNSQHENTRPLTANKTHETIRDLKSELLKHPTYSPDLAPCDFHVVEPLKDMIRGVHSWLGTQPPPPTSVPAKLFERWAKCTEKGREYLEK